MNRITELTSLVPEWRNWAGLSTVLRKTPVGIMIVCQHTSKSDPPHSYG
ncbi:hypothetical protein [Citrobacter freundii]|nr:hypothetical protein [Citrobacter freundii]MDE9727349.1 hypothetical protein [Citrobacter freundii]